MCHTGKLRLYSPNSVFILSLLERLKPPEDVNELAASVASDDSSDNWDRPTSETCVLSSLRPLLALDTREEKHELDAEAKGERDDVRFSGVSSDTEPLRADIDPGTWEVLLFLLL